MFQTDKAMRDVLQSDELFDCKQVINFSQFFLIFSWIYQLYLAKKSLQYLFSIANVLFWKSMVQIKDTAKPLSISLT